MKSTSPVALALAFAFSQEAVIVAATPVITKQTRQIPGQVTLCNPSNQCGIISVPFDRTTVCTNLNGEFVFLNDQLKTMTLTEVGCLAFQDFGCSGTNFGGDVALGNTLTIDFTNFNGQNDSGFISSVSCTFV